MSAPAYSLEAWRRLREKKDQAPESAVPPTTLADIPADAEMDEGLVIGFWNGERFVSWERWLATAPLSVAREAATPGAPEVRSDVWLADCGGTRIWVVRDGDRWVIYAASRAKASRRRDFASPFLAHAQRTAEAWYGSARDGWHAEPPPAANVKRNEEVEEAK